MNLPPSFTKSH